MRIVNFVLAVMFLLFAFVQINDPDPILWILIYGIMAVTCVLAAFNFYFRKVLIALTVLYVAYSTIYIGGVMEWLGSEDKSALFDEIAKMQYPYIEETREFLGLIICVAVLVFYIFKAPRKAS
jgi:hypothetical protein